jgi:recombination protein RecA
MRITVRAGEHIKVGKNVSGCKSKIKFVKNKVAAPFKEAEVIQVFGDGFEPVANLLDSAVDLKVIEMNGSRYTFGGEEIANGRDDTIEMLRLNFDLMDQIMTACRAKAFPTKAAAETLDEEETLSQENR